MKKMTFLGGLGMVLAFSLILTGNSQAWEGPHDPTSPPNYGFPKPKPPCGDKMWIAIYPKPCVDEPQVPHRPVQDWESYCKGKAFIPESNHPCLTWNRPRPPRENPWGWTKPPVWRPHHRGEVAPR